jgi:heme/copper-type cytochrome/quinol oxidase subunit 1
MRTLIRVSNVVGTLSLFASLLVHRYAATGVWAGFPYQADIMTYPNSGFNLMAVGLAVLGMTCLVYGTLLSVMQHNVENQELNQRAKLVSMYGNK